MTWNPSTKQFEGFEDLGDGDVSDNKKAAGEALVFMAVGLNGHWKVPIGYFLINGISGEQQAALVREGLHHLHDAGIQVAAFVCDGCGTNHATAVHLGCNLLADQLKGTFPHPVTSEPVAFLFDVCHMIKLMRNTLASEGKLHLPPDEPGGTEKVCIALLMIYIFMKPIITVWLYHAINFSFKKSFWHSDCTITDLTGNMVS